MVSRRAAARETRWIRAKRERGRTGWFSLARVTRRKHEANDKYRYTQRTKCVVWLLWLACARSRRKKGAVLKWRRLLRPKDREESSVCLPGELFYCWLEKGYVESTLNPFSLSVTFVSCQKKQWLDREKCYQWNI